MKRKPTTIWLSAAAITRLEEMHKRLRPHTDRKRSVSPGKIVELLILEEDAFDYAEKRLLKNNVFSV